MENREITIEGTATSKYIRISPIKVNRVLNQIRGKNYQEARLILEFMQYKSCKVIKKVLESAAANAVSSSQTNKNLLIIQKAFVGQGPRLKRFKARAQGRAFPIRKPTCHITITLNNYI